MLHLMWERNLQLLDQVGDAAWGVFKEFLMEDHKRIRKFVFLNTQGRQPLYLPFENFCTVPVATMVCTTTIPVLVLYFIGDNLLFACFVRWSVTSLFCITHDYFSLSIQILTPFNILYYGSSLRVGILRKLLFSKISSHKRPLTSLMVSFLSQLEAQVLYFLSIFLSNFSCWYAQLYYVSKAEYINAI